MSAVITTVPPSASVSVPVLVELTSASRGNATAVRRVSAHALVSGLESHYRVHAAEQGEVLPLRFNLFGRVLHHMVDSVINQGWTGDELSANLAGMGALMVERLCSCDHNCKKTKTAVVELTNAVRFWALVVPIGRKEMMSDARKRVEAKQGIVSRLACEAIKPTSSVAEEIDLRNYSRMVVDAATMVGTIPLAPAEALSLFICGIADAVLAVSTGDGDSACQRSLVALREIRSVGSTYGVTF